MTEAAEKAEGLTNAPIEFGINDARIAEVKAEYADIDAYENFDEAKAAKKTLTEMRSKVTARHKVVKHDALQFGKRCDAEKRRLMALIAEIEDPITKQLDDIKHEAERKEAARQKKIDIAIDEIRNLEIGHMDLNSEQAEARLTELDLIGIDDNIFQERIDEANATYNEVRVKLMSSLERAKAREEQERLLEEQRKEQEKEQKRLAKQREEQEERERKMRAEEEARLEEERKKQAEKEAELEAERKAQAEKEAEIERERQKLEDERKAEEDRKRKAAEEKAAEERRLALAPDKDKLLRLHNDVSEMELPQVVEEAAQGVLDDFVANMQKALAILKSDAEGLK